MRFDLMPAEERARREAADNLRGLCVILLIFVVFENLVNLVLSIPRNWWIEAAINIPQLFVTIAFVVNAYAGYRFWSANKQLIIVLSLIAVVLTVMMHFYGSTSGPHPALYTLLIFIATIYISTRSGAYAFGLSTVLYAGMVGGEEAGLLTYAAFFPEKQPITTIPDYAWGMFVLVFAINAVTFATSLYIARALMKRRVEVEKAKNAAETALEELAAANAKLIELDEAKNRFLSVVSHDLRTPITSIRAFGELIEEETTHDDHKSFAHTIVTEADRLRRLVTDLLDLDKMEAGKMEWDLHRQDIRPVLEASAQVFRAAAADKGVTLTEEYADDLPDIAADQDRLSQLIANLLSNAIKFTPEGGTVTLRAHAGEETPAPPGGADSPETGFIVHAPATDDAQRSPNGMVISVTDTGPGIAPEESGALFDRFSQTAAGKDTAGGTGLGLAIAREIAHGHGGDITVASAPGRGATFTVKLPVN